MTRSMPPAWAVRWRRRHGYGRSCYDGRVRVGLGLLLLHSGLLLQLAQGVKVADAPRDIGGVPNEEFIWETLPGRCCFAGYMDPISKVWNGVATCDECNVWSEPDNYCHKSAETCLKCGKPLYCEKPPPLITGNQVCIGRSRVGTGCFDEIDTGICGAKGLRDCQQACRENSRCEQLVFYPDKMAGSCVLCRDLVEVEELHTIKTRVYSNTPAPPPPSYPKSSKAEGWHLFPSPSPPSPPRPPPRRPARPPAPRFHMKQNFDCSYFPEVEFTVDTDRGYTDRVAATKEECCNFCGAKQGCKDFVFEPGSGTCVLLPSGKGGHQVVRTHNEYTVAGSIKATPANAHLQQHAVCTTVKEAGLAQGSLGEAPELPFGREMKSAQDCCDACEMSDKCAHFTFEQFSKACILFEPYAQQFDAPSSTLMVGTVAGRGTETTLGKGSGLDEQTMKLIMAEMYLPPPAPPAFNAISKPPPAPPPGETVATKSIMAGFSLGVIGLFGLALILCTYCFFSTDVLHCIHHVSGGRFGKPQSSPHARLPTAEDPFDQPRRNRRKGRNNPMDDMDEGAVQVTLETSAMTQRKAVNLSQCVNFKDVHTAVVSEFSHAVQHKKPQDLLLFCLVDRPVEPVVRDIDSDADSDDDIEKPQGEATEQCWLLVTPRSNLELVLACAALKLKEKPDEPIEYEKAFEPLAPAKPPKPTKKAAAEAKETARKAAQAERAARERFDDTALEPDEDDDDDDDDDRFSDGDGSDDDDDDDDDDDHRHSHHHRGVRNGVGRKSPHSDLHRPSAGGERFDDDDDDDVGGGGRRGDDDSYGDDDGYDDGDVDGCGGASVVSASVVSASVVAGSVIHERTRGTSVRAPSAVPEMIFEDVPMGHVDLDAHGRAEDRRRSEEDHLGGRSVVTSVYDDRDDGFTHVSLNTFSSMRSARNAPSAAKANNLD